MPSRTATASYERPTRLKGRGDEIKWTDLLDKFKSVQERARRQQMQYNNVKTSANPHGAAALANGAGGAGIGGFGGATASILSPSRTSTPAGSAMNAAGTNATKGTRGGGGAGGGGMGGGSNLGRLATGRSRGVGRK